MTMQQFTQRTMPEGLEGLAELALDLRWCGSQTTDRLWEMLDPEAWERTKNPYMILQNVSQARLEAASHDKDLLRVMQEGLEHRRLALANGGWFQEKHGDTPLKSIAYFSMEFGLTEALPIYSGGLGVLAGDHIKTASDMGLPLVAIGLLYQQGYFRQLIAKDGWQLEALPYNDPTSLPVTPVPDPDGGWLRIKVWLPGRPLLLRVWEARVGKIKLYLLDSNDPLNTPWDRGITANLYAGDQERRLIQEIVLGHGGWRVLEELGIEPDVCHLNEGHAAFVVLARARSFMLKHNVSFYEALWATRAGNVFTTHTAVAAGFDRFNADLVYQYAQHVAEAIDVPVEYLMSLGRKNPEDPNEPCNMAYLAMRGCAHINAVSRLHGVVSRNIFADFFPGWPIPEVPVGHVTNGVHVPSWDSHETHELWSRACGDERWSSRMELVELNEQNLNDRKLWEFRSDARKRLVEYVRRRMARQVQAQGASPAQVERARHVLDPNALTLGFARRFATYKRPTLLLHDIERLARILNSTERPVQLIIAGKAHPDDKPGKMLVQQIAQTANRPDLVDRMVFLADYDMALSQELVSGVDVWLNTPRRPWEASGTSGMKVLCNGGLNLSELDGWWAEAYDPEVGWALGDGQEHWNDPNWDNEEAEQFYGLLEREIVPAFYARDAEGLPRQWLRHVRASMNRLTPQFSSHRMLREYVEDYYLPAAWAYCRRSDDGAALAKELAAWQKALDDGWKGLRLANARATHEGECWSFELHVYLGDLDAEDVTVELYADPVDQFGMERVPMERVSPIAGAVNAFVYRTRVPAVRPAEHYTPRVVPHHAEAFIPLEDSRIAWLK